MKESEEELNDFEKEYFRLLSEATEDVFCNANTQSKDEIVKCIKAKRKKIAIFSLNPNRKYMLILQNPAKLVVKRMKFYKSKMGEKENEDVKVKKAETIEEAISGFQQGFRDWLLERNKGFTEKFFVTLKKYGLIKYKSLENYINNEFFNDFYVTDLSKKRNEMKEFDKDFEKNGEKWLKLLDHEIEAFIKKNRKKKKLIFVFGSRAWPEFRKRYSCKCLTKRRENDLDPVTAAHGHLFSINNSNTYVIPLSHPSGQAYTKTLRNSYMDYLSEGLKKWAKQPDNVCRY